MQSSPFPRRRNQVMITKKLGAYLITVGVLVMMFFFLAPMLPLPVEIQKQAISVLYSDESYAKNVASNVVRILQRPNDFGFENQDSVIRWLKDKSWVTPDGGSRRITVEPELLGDIGWPTIVNSIKVTLVYNRDGSRSVHRYYGSFQLW